MKPDYLPRVGERWFTINDMGDVVEVEVVEVGSKRPNTMWFVKYVDLRDEDYNVYECTSSTWRDMRNRSDSRPMGMNGLERAILQVQK